MNAFNIYSNKLIEILSLGATETKQILCLYYETQRILDKVSLIFGAEYFQYGFCTINTKSLKSLYSTGSIFC